MTEFAGVPATGVRTTVDDQRGGDSGAERHDRGVGGTPRGTEAVLGESGGAHVVDDRHGQPQCGGRTFREREVPPPQVRGVDPHSTVVHDAGDGETDRAEAGSSCAQIRRCRRDRGHHDASRIARIAGSGVARDRAEAARLVEHGDLDLRSADVDGEHGTPAARAGGRSDRRVVAHEDRMTDRVRLRGASASSPPDRARASETRCARTSSASGSASPAK